MPVQAAGDGVRPRASPTRSLIGTHVRAEQRGPTPPLFIQVVKGRDDAGLQAGQKCHAAGGAFQTRRPPHCEAGAVSLRLQQRIGCSGSSVDGQLAQALTERRFRKLNQCRHREGDAFQGCPCDVGPLAVAGQTDQQAPSLWIPVGGAPAGECRDQHHATGIGNLHGQSIDLGGVVNDAKAIAQPLNDSAGIEQTSLQAVGGSSVGVGPSKGAQQSRVGASNLSSCVDHEKSTGPIGAFALARLQAELTKRGCLLITQQCLDR